MDPLIEIPREKWPELRDLYKVHWPQGAEAHCLLDIQIDHPAMSQEIGLHVYCPEGNLANGMVATSLTNNYYQVIIQPIGINTAKIEESLLTTKVIDWNRTVMVPFANAATIECLNRIKDQLGIRVIYNTKTKAYIHFLDKSVKKFDNLSLPPNTYIEYLRPEHVEVVDKTWTYHSENSHKTFEMLMKYNLSYVLYLKTKAEANEHAKHIEMEDKTEKADDKTDKVNKKEKATTTKLQEDHIKNIEERKEDVNEPLAWLSVNEHGALSHLYCSEHHRRKGYGEIITKYVVNELLSKGYNIIAFTVEGNATPQNLFKKLGFKDLGYDHWVIIHKATAGTSGMSWSGN